MHTSESDRAETRTIAIAAPPDAVLAVVGDALRLPEWAPNLASAVRRDGATGAVEAPSRRAMAAGAATELDVDNGSAEFPSRLRVAAELGTVDILRREDPPRGAFARVAPVARAASPLHARLPGRHRCRRGRRPEATVEAELRTSAHLSRPGAEDSDLPRNGPRSKNSP